MTGKFQGEGGLAIWSKILPSYIQCEPALFQTVPLGDRCPSGTPRPPSAAPAEEEDPTAADNPLPALSDGSDPAVPAAPTVEDPDSAALPSETAARPTAAAAAAGCLPTTCLSTDRRDRWDTPAWDTRAWVTHLTARPGDILTDRQAQDPSTAQGPEDPSRDLSAVGRRVRVCLTVPEDHRVHLTARADTPWAPQGPSAPSTVHDRHSETGSVEAAADLGAAGEEEDLETDQVRQT